MTVCIAAMSESSTRLILITDQMITATPGIACQYETDDVSKNHELLPHVVALVAGATLWAFEIIDATRRRIAIEHPTGFAEVAELLRLEYQALRRRVIIQSMLEPRGLDLASYYQNQQTLHPNVVQDIDNDFRNYDLGVEMIVAGHDDGVCHISSLANPGILFSQNAHGDVCVGSGAPHALYHLIGAGYKKSMPSEAVESLAKEAKQRSEMAPGVGSDRAISFLSRRSSGEQVA